MTRTQYLAALKGYIRAHDAAYPGGSNDLEGKYIRALKKTVMAFDAAPGLRGLRGRDAENDLDDDQDMDEQQIAEALRAALPPSVFERIMSMLASASPEQGETETPELEYGDRSRRRAKDGLRSGILPSAGRAMDAAPSNRHSAGFAARFPGARQPKQEGGVV